MSGIAALVALDGRMAPREVLEAMITRAAHRGDERPVVWATPAVALGHAHRARTPEAEDERLPESDNSGRYWLTWDGRLDNREELAQRLGVKPAVAATLPDSALVLRAFARWDDDAPAQLLGDWSLVVYDRIRHRIIASRDPVGLRPLFGAEVDGLVALVSEPQQLFACDFVQPTPDLDYVHRFLANAMPAETTTYYEGVFEIVPGTVLTADEHSIERRTFWSAPSSKIQSRSIEETVEEFTAIFDQAVRARLRSNGPVGVFLSGGIDSSYVAAVAGDYLSPIAITSYAPGTTRMDERRYAEIAAAHSNSRLVLADITDCWTFSSKQLSDDAFDQPLHPGQGAGYSRLAQVAASEGARVALDGIGGDEWHTGASFYLAEAVAQGRLMKAWQIASHTPRRKPAGALLAREIYRGLTPLSARRAVHRVVGRGELTRFDFTGYVEPDTSWEGIPARIRDVSALDRQAYYRETLRIHRQVNVPDFLWRDRQADQAPALERRSPFHDLRVIEFMATVPEWMKRHRGRRKDLLRDAVARRMPVIADRLDHGLYDELFLAGVRGQESARMREALDAVSGLAGVNAGEIRRDVQSFLSGQHEWWYAPWRALSVGLWLTQVDTLRRAPGTADSRSPAILQQPIGGLR